MPDLFASLSAILGNFEMRSLIDILVVALLIYWLLVLLRGSTAITLLRAIAAVYLIGFFFSTVFQLTVVGWLLRNSLPAMLVGIPILFQPELRRVLEQVGRGFRPWRRGLMNAAMLDTVDAVSEACQALSQRHIGALIVMERDTGLQEYIDQGVKLDAALSSGLLVALFHPGSPFHDGAIVLRQGRIVATRCVLPLAESGISHLNMGTRHRAALGIAERTDALAIAVSEERGSVLLAGNGHSISLFNGDGLREVLLSYYLPARRNGATATEVPAAEVTHG